MMLASTTTLNWVLVGVILIGICTSITAVILAHRQDEIAKRASMAVALIAKSAKASTDALLAHQHATDIKLDRIERTTEKVHSLVNSNLTLSKQQQLDQTKISLILMKKVIDLKKAAGHTPAKEDYKAIKLTEEKIGELEHELADRKKTQSEIDKQK